MHSGYLPTVLLILGSMLPPPVTLCSQTPNAQYHLARRIPTDGKGTATLGLDYKWRRLYGTGASVIDIDHDSVVGHLPESIGHAFAFAPELDRGITRRGAIFDLRTLAVLDSGIGKSENDVAYDALSHSALIVGTVTMVVDVQSDKRTTLPGMGGPGIAAVSADPGFILIRLETDSIVRFDMRTLTADVRWGIKGCSTGRNMTIDRTHRRLLIPCNNDALAVMDIDNGRIVTVVPVPGAGAAWQPAFDSTSGLIFVPTGRGTMAILHEDSPDQFTLLSAVASAEGGSAAVVDERTHRVFLYGHRKDDILRVLVFEPEAPNERVGASAR